MSDAQEKKGLLLVNLGTPQAPTASALKDYLSEFLMDKFVIDVPWFWRWFLVHVLIVPRRAQESAKLYQKIWTENGSPLFFHTQNLAKKVAARLAKTPVSFAMRYGKPSIKEGLRELRQRGVQKVILLPLYPQYSEAATRSSIEEVQKHAEKMNLGFEVIQDFYQHSAYLQAVEKVSAPHLEQPHDFVLFSYHGLPERQKNSGCYRAQCFATTESLVKILDIPEEKYASSFQSRLGKMPWIQPYTDHVLTELAAQGKKRVIVLCPSFVADCLETLEEIAGRAKETFIEAGGEDLILVPSLNAEDIWADAVVKIIETMSLRGMK